MTTLTCISPIDGSVFAERPALSRADADAAIARARKAQPAWAARPLEERIAVVRAGIAALGAMGDETVVELARMMGRPIRYGGEFRGVDERASYMADIAADALAPLVAEDSPAFDRRVLRAPHGLILVVSPWNYPYMTAINTIVPGLIAGNAVLMKGSTQTLLAGERLARALHAGGVPEAVFQNLYLDHAVTTDLIAARTFGFVNFTGSVGAGQAIERAAAGGFTAVGLELGGKDPGYVTADADVAAAAETLIDGAMFNSGQSCCGIERIYVHADVFDDFVDRARALIEDYVLGDPLDPATSLGPMAHTRFAALVRAQIADAAAAGAQPLIDPKRFADDGGAYLAPQMLIDVHHGMLAMREESFGPLVGVMKVESDDEAVALMNDSDFGLTASLWTRDADRAAALADRIETGTVFMNRCDYLDPALCWTGCKNTGRGAALSPLGFHAVTRPKSLHFKKG